MSECVCLAIDSLCFVCWFYLHFQRRPKWWKWEHLAAIAAASNNNTHTTKMRTMRMAEKLVFIANIFDLSALFSIEHNCWPEWLCSSCFFLFPFFCCCMHHSKCSMRLKGGVGQSTEGTSMFHSWFGGRFSSRIFFSILFHDIILCWMGLDRLVGRMKKGWFDGKWHSDDQLSGRKGLDIRPISRRW